jgi:hypothetical protein
MRSTEDWLNEQLENYNEDPITSLSDILYTTINVTEQFLNNPNSNASKSLIESCLKHNKLFLQKIQNN